MAVISSAKIRYDPLRSLVIGSITSLGYTGVGSVFTNPPVAIKINNPTNANLLISYDGITPNDFVAANSAFVFDYNSNKSNQAGVAQQPAGDRVYVKSEAANPTTGVAVYATVIYLSDV
jgi:hypothetical protein